jgi:pyrimidine-nucleoside phosphorylase
MNIVELIAKKRDGGHHTLHELEYLMNGVVSGKVEQYQMAAWLMATWINGMSVQETVWLTQAMIDSGETVDLSELGGIPVDKHSTGGVADTTTLILAPLVAAAGGKVAKMSGRGLGHTGGTLDKMEAAGLNVNLDSNRFMAQVKEIGVAVISQTAQLVPADGILYSLRDVTATIDSIPLIASSVMSKKLACGAQAILLDVKYGDGAFMTELEGAKELARVMVDIGNGLGRRVKAALSSMDQPLGSAIGNALEFREAIEVLTGKKSDTALARVSRQLAAELLVMSEVCPDRGAADAKVNDMLSSGAAAAKLKEMIKHQNGNPEIVDDPDKLPQAPITHEVKASSDGYLQAIAARQLGLAALGLGAGRLKKSDVIDPAVGIVLNKRIGDPIATGDVLAVIHAATEQGAKTAEKRILEAITLSTNAVQAPPEIAAWVE